MAGEFLPLIKGSGRRKLVVLSSGERVEAWRGAGVGRMEACAWRAEDSGIVAEMVLARGATIRCASGIPDSG